MELANADGKITAVWPMLYATITDWQEGCVAAATKSGNKTNCPCHSCLVLRGDLNDLAAGRAAPLRTEQQMRLIYDQVVRLHREGKPGCKAVIDQLTTSYSVNVVEVRGRLVSFFRQPLSFY
jgi:hypothetical protein